MTAYIRYSSLSVSDLNLVLTDELGQLQDAEYVNWTIMSAYDGKQISGKLLAIRKSVGVYYAPWFADVQTGAYEIIWEYRRSQYFNTETFTERFFIIEPGNATSHCHVMNLPPPGGHVFEMCDKIEHDNLILRLADKNGKQVNAHCVTWQIWLNDESQFLTHKIEATKLDVGLYGVDWHVNVCGGQYKVKWEWREHECSPLQSATDIFQVVNQHDPTQGVTAVNWLQGQ
jgi:hypothetical protein